MLKKLVVALLICLSLPTLLAARNEATRLKELGKKVEAIDLKQRTEGQRLKNIDKNISAMQDAIALVQKEVESLDNKITWQKTQIRYYQMALSQSKGTLRKKWVALYEGAFIDMVDVLYTHAEYSGYVDAIISKNKEELTGYQKTRARLVEAKGRLDEASKAQKENLNNLEGKIGMLNAERQRKGVLLASLGRQKESYQEEIQRLLKQLQARKKELPNRGMSKKQGDLPWPVTGQIVRGFGISHEAGYAQISHGVDIEAEGGAPVKTIYAGKVVFYDWITKFGNTLIIDHGGGLYSVYGHLQKAVKSNGDPVNAKETIALVGQSGDVMKPTLHFEIRFKDKPQDPVKWLSRQ